MPLDFTSAGTSVVRVPDDTSIQNIFAGGVTLMFWFRPDDTTNNTRLVHKGAWNAFLPGRIALVHEFSTSNGRWNAETGSSPAGAWHHADRL